MKMMIAVSTARALVEPRAAIVGALDLAGEARSGQPFVGERLHRAVGADQLRGIGGGFGQRILRIARQPPHPAPERHQRQHDQRDHQQHEAGQPRAGHHHHGDSAGEQHEVAQRDRDRRADGRLDLGRVGGEPRDQFAAARGIEERRRQRRQMREHFAPDVGDDPLADGHHQVVARGAGDGEDRDDGDHHGEVVVDHRDAVGGEAEVDHPPHGDRDDQRRQGRDDQGDQRAQRPAAVARHIGQQRQQRPQFCATLGCCRQSRCGAVAWRQPAGSWRRAPADRPARRRRSAPTRSLNLGRQLFAPGIGQAGSDGNCRRLSPS